MDGQILQRHFTHIGAELDINIRQPITNQRVGRWIRPVGMEGEYLLDIHNVSRQERFALAVRSDVVRHIEVSAINIRTDLRHLLLMTRTTDGQKRKLLCGHDERHWFVAAVPSNTVTVAEAMDRLKPPVVQQALLVQGVPYKNWNRRNTEAFVRQGEWFFLPRPQMILPQGEYIHRNEPIARGGGKAHIVEQVYRTKGEMVYVSTMAPNGITPSQYQRLIQRNPAAIRKNWQRMVRNAGVYARGTVRHPDHKTITLPFWHEVLMNNEERDKFVAFLD